MDEDFFEKRRRARGLVRSSDSKTADEDFFETRRMERGLIPDTRPKPKVEPVSPPLTADQFITGSNRAVAGIHNFIQQGEDRQSERKRQEEENKKIKAAEQKKKASSAPKLLQLGHNISEKVDDLLFGDSLGTGNRKPMRPVLQQVGDFHDRTRLDIPGTKIDNAIGNFVQGAGDTATFGASTWMNRQMDRQEVADGATESKAGKIGQVAGTLIPGGAAWKLGGTAVRGIGNSALRTGLRGAIGGAAYGTGRELGEAGFGVNNQSLSGRAADVGLDAAFGAGGDLLLSGAGNALKGAAQRAASGITKRALGSFNAVEQVGRESSLVDNAVARISSIDEEIGNLSSRPNKSGSYNDELSALVNERKHAVDYIKQFDPEFNAPESAVVKPDDIPLMRTATTPQPASIPMVSPQMQERGFAQTLRESDKTPQGFKETLKSSYKPITNEQTLLKANQRINKDTEESTSFVLGNSRFTAEKATVAQRLIDHYNSQGNYQRSVDIAQKVSEEATRAGQSIQALSMFNRLTPEGVLIHAQRIASKVNEKSSVFSKEAKITPDMAADITGLAKATQKMTGVKDLSNNVIDILERAKSGEKLTDTEAQILKRFVNESKEFVKETAKKPKPPRAPQRPKDKRVRDNVVSFLDAQEQAAKERLRAKGINISSTPLDVWADYAVIGAAKMGRNVVKFADWSEAMVKDLGEDIRPHLQNLYERSREAYEASTKKVSQQTINVAEKLTEKVITNKQLAPKEADSLRALAQKVSGLSGEAKRLASQDLQAILQGLEKPGVLKRISSVQTMGQLLNPKTQVRNSLGNELFYRLERLNKLISTPIDIVRSKITGGERTVTFRTNNQGQYWKNWFRGLQAGWKGVNVNGLETQYDLGSPAFKSKYNPLTYLEKSLGAALKSFDTAAYMRGYNDTLGEMATLRAINEGKRGDKTLIQKYIREADDNVMKIADEYGRYVTFQDNNLISQGLVKLKRGLNLGKDFGAGDMIIKYPKTPGALLMRALEYSPAGFLRSAMILARPLMKKEANTAEVTQALTRAIIGTAGLSGMGYFLMEKGILTGAASKDKDIRGLQQSAGQGQYQVNLSALMRLVKSGFDPAEAKLRENDHLYTYDWMQPASIAVSIGANVKNNLDKGKDGLTGIAGTAYNSLEGGLGTLTEQSVLSGLKQAAEGYPGQTVTDKIMDIVSDIPASFVPTVSNQIKQLQDNARRETYDPSKTKQSLNRAQAKIPGLAGRLPQQYDTLGQPKETYQNNSPFNVLLNPGFSSRYKLSPEAKYVVDLISESGDETLAPRVPGKTITVDGESIKLNGDMFARYQQLLGEQNKEQIAKRAERDSGKSLDRRSKNMTKALTTAGDKARKELRKELGYKK